MNQDDYKRLAAEAALEYVPEAGLIGLGTGSTARFFIAGMAELVRGGRAVVGVPTSNESHALAERLGIPLAPDDGPWDIALCVDGADEVSTELDLIKGAGGAQHREKIVNYASRKNVIIVDQSKLSARLGERCAVPIEVLPFGHRGTARHLEIFGKPTLRERGGVVFRTDSGNVIYDLATGPIADPVALEATLAKIPGVVETGLFCGRADVVVVAGPDGPRRLTRD